MSYDGGAGNQVLVFDGLLTALGEQRETALGTAKALPTIPSDAAYALISVEAQPVRIRMAGGTATASAGLLLPVGSVLGLNLGAAGLALVNMIETTAGAAVSVAYFK